MRDQTRVQRYQSKLETAKFLPISLVTIEFQQNCNLGLIIRSAVCFGVKDVHVIGFIPPYAELRSNSGSTNHFVNIIQHKTPSEFLFWRRKEAPDTDLLSLELTDEAESIVEYQLERHSFLVLGNESTGVPTEILHQSKVLYLPMKGIGYCLNVSCAATAALYELARK